MLGEHFINKMQTYKSSINTSIYVRTSIKVTITLSFGDRDLCGHKIGVSVYITKQSTLSPVRERP